MCGLVGVAGKLVTVDELLIKRLLFFDYFRGPDSTGIAVVNKGMTEAQIAKIASHPIDLFDMSRFKKMVSGYTSSVFLGHNRAATVGKVNGINAHPFQFDHIVGAHNGTLSPSSFKELKEALNEDYETDSAAIFASIAKFGIDKTAKMLQGAWALVWVNLKEGTLNFLKNKERPLWYTYAKDFSTIVWASEYQTIRSATKAEKSEYETHTDGKYGYWSFEDDTHYKYYIDDFLLLSLKEPPKVTTRPLKGKEPAPVVSYYSGKGNFHNQTPTHQTIGTGSSPRGGTKGTEVLEFWVEEGSVDVYQGIVTRGEFEFMAATGCSFCGEDVAYGDEGITIFKDSGVLLCPGCSHDKDKTRIYVNSLDTARDLAA